MTWWEHIRYFKEGTLDKLACSCCGRNLLEKEHMLRLDMLRHRYGKPIKVTSGYRCPAHDLSQGTSSTPGEGPHTTGFATDIVVENKYELIPIAYSVGMTGIGVYRNFIHLDSLGEDRYPGKRPALWGR